MFLLKIGKERQKFKLTIKLHKIVYTELSKVPNDAYIKVIVER